MTQTSTPIVPSLAQWETLATKELKGSPAALSRRVAHGIALHALATEADREGLAHLGELPGCAPFVRGAEALQAPFALPTHVPDPSELEALGTEAPLARSVLHLGPTFASVPALDRLVDIAGKRGVDPGHLRATIDFDPVGEFVTDRIDEAGFEKRLAEAAPLLRAVSLRSPMVRVLLLRSRWFQHQGADLVLETACAIAGGVTLVRGLERHGITPDLVASHLAFRFAVTTDIAAEIARLRIVRGLWAKIGRAFGVLHKSALQMHQEAETSEVTCTTRDPHTNLVRSTLQAFAAAAAGCETLTVLPHDAREHRWSEFAVRIARNQQRLLEHEGHLDRTADPFGGSYAIEALSDRFGRAIWTELQRIEKEGGLLVALRGPLKQRLAESLAERRRSFGSGEEVLIGSNKFQPMPGPLVHPPDAKLWHADDDVVTGGSR